MEQKRKPFQELIKAGGMSEGNSVEVNSVEELTELLQDGTMLSLMVEVNSNG